MDGKDLNVTSKLSSTLSESVTSTEDETKEKFSGSKEELKEAVDNLLSKSSYKAEEAITFLEEKLAELKKQNAKLQK